MVADAMGRRMRELRERIGWTQGLVAERLGVSRVAVSHWEKGRNFPKHEQLVEFARLAGVSLDNLVKGCEAYLVESGDSAASLEEALGRRMRTARETAGLKQQDVADAIGVTRGAISQFECGENLPSLKSLADFARFVKCSVDTLLGLDAPRGTAAEQVLEVLIEGSLVVKVPYRGGDLTVRVRREQLT